VKKFISISLFSLLWIISLSTIAFATVVENDSTTSATYSGSWNVQQTSGSWGAYEQDCHTTSTVGAFVEYSFNGQEISVMGGYGTNFGMVDVYMDGIYHSTLDLFMESTILYQRQLVNIYGLSSGNHTLKMVLSSDKNSNSSGNLFVIDRFDVMDTNRAKNGTTTVSSSVEGYNWSVNKLIDGNTGYYGWSSSNQLQTNHEESVMIDLLYPTYINKIDLYPAASGEYFPIGFSISVSYDNEQWAEVVSESGYEITGIEAQPFSFPTQLVRYIKIIGNDLNQNPNENNWFRMQLSDVQAFYIREITSNTVVAESNQSYYVSYSDGNDNNDGKTPATAWKTLKKASSYLYSGGNHILLEKGDSWNDDSLQLQGNGSKINPIVISSYGDGSNPLIKAGLTGGFGIHIRNQEGYLIDGISFSDSVCGIYIENELAINKQYIEIVNCNFSNIEGTCIDPGDNTTGNLRMPYPSLYFGAGIAFTSTLDISTSNNTVISDVVIGNNNFIECDTGILMFVRDYPFGLDGMPSNAWYFNRKAYDDVHIYNCNVDKSYRSGGIMLYSTSGIVEDCIVTRTGYQKGMFWGVAAIQATLCEDLIVDNCEMAYTYLNPGDGEGFDFESGNVNVQLINSLIHDNEGPAILFYGENGGWKNDNQGNIVRNCVIYDNGSEDHAESWSERVFKCYTNNTGIIEDCFIKLKYNGQPYNASPMSFMNNCIYDEFGLILSSNNVNKISDWNSNIIYSGYGWAMDYASGYTDGYAHKSLLANAYTEYSFSGTQIDVISSITPNGGSFDVYIDNVYKETVNCMGIQTEYRKILFTSESLSSEQIHVIKLVSKSNAPVSYDGFVVSEGVASEINDWDASILYSGYGWIMDYDPEYTDGYAHMSLLANAFTEYTFIGMQIDVISSIAPNSGSFDVYIDNEFIETVNCIASEKEYRRILFTSGRLSNQQTHVIRLVSKSNEPVIYDGFVVSNGSYISWSEFIEE